MYGTKVILENFEFSFSFSHLQDSNDCILGYKINPIDNFLFLTEDGLKMA